LNAKSLADYVDGDSVKNLLRDMIREASVNPPGAESGCANVVAEKLRGLGVDVELVEKEKGRTNVVARIKGTKGTPVLLYNGHIDVVPVGNGWTKDPFGGEIVDGVLYGRGTADMKSGVASMVAAAEAIVKSGAKLKGDLIITAVADEETGSAKGTRHLIERGLKADMAVVSEPTDLRIEIAHKGILWAEITTKGRGSHASRPHLGVNAIDKMNSIINALHEIKLEGYNPLFDVPQPVLSVTTITGGTKINVISDQCTIEFDRRLLPGETPEYALKQIKDAVAKAKAEDPTLDATIKVQEEWPAMEVAPEEKIVQTLARVVEARTGVKPKFYGKAAGTDASWLVRDAKIPTVLYGPGDPRFSHTADEHVELSKVTEAARVFAVLAGEALGVE
jgi:acetylornithine deacetylase/succinyl-diaminopimelate desuccinylase family protein